MEAANERPSSEPNPMATTEGVPPTTGSRASAASDQRASRPTRASIPSATAGIGDERASARAAARVRHPREPSLESLPVGRIRVCDDGAQRPSSLGPRPCRHACTSEPQQRSAGTTKARSPRCSSHNLIPPGRCQSPGRGRSASPSSTEHPSSPLTSWARQVRRETFSPRRQETEAPEIDVRGQRRRAGAWQCSLAPRTPPGDLGVRQERSRTRTSR
jgi:hypothetical protein